MSDGRSPTSWSRTRCNACCRAAAPSLARRTAAVADAGSSGEPSLVHLHCWLKSEPSNHRSKHLTGGASIKGGEGNASAVPEGAQDQIHAAGDERDLLQAGRSHYGQVVDALLGHVTRGTIMRAEKLRALIAALIATSTSSRERGVC